MPVHTDDRVRWFVRRADERMAAEPDTAKSGLFNGNVAVPDKATSVPRTGTRFCGTPSWSAGTIRTTRWPPSSSGA